MPILVEANVPLLGLVRLSRPLLHGLEVKHAPRLYKKTSRFNSTFDRRNPNRGLPFQILDIQISAVFDIQLDDAHRLVLRPARRSVSVVLDEFQGGEV